MNRKRKPSKKTLDGKWAHRVKARASWHCEICGDTIGLAAHHIFGKQAFPGWRHVLENGIALCFLCHHNIHNDPDFKHEVHEMIGAEGIRDEFMRDVGTIID